MKNACRRLQSTQRYLRTYLICCLCVSLVFVSLSAHGRSEGIRSGPHTQLLRYQQDKLAAATGLTTVLLGDSSLGHAIDANLFERLSGERTINLALNGDFGFAGTYNLLRATLRRNQVKNVIIMNTLDIMRRDVEYDGYLLSAGREGVFSRDFGLNFHLAQRFLERMFSIREALRGFKMLVGLYDLRAETPRMVNDFWEQNMDEHEEVISRPREPLDPKSIPRHKTYFLSLTASLCRANGLNCLFVYGPVLETHCRISRAYIKAATARIAATGIEVVSGMPLCVPPTEVGDTMDHIAPPYKDEYTRRYYHLLAPKLRQMSRDGAPLAEPDGSHGPRVQ